MLPGVSVPLRQIADIKPVWTEGQIVHRNGLRCISVLADVKRGYNTTAVFKNVSKQMDKKFMSELPEGMKAEYGGVIENDTDTMKPMGKGIAAAVVIIFFILVFHFRKISLAILVLASALLSLLGAAFGYRFRRNSHARTYQSDWRDCP
jgi:multidrug efflux pump subunit AcrB